MNPLCFARSSAIFAIACAILTILITPAAAQIEQVLFSFDRAGIGIDPKGSLVFDSQGNLYGTTVNSFGQYDYGIVFELNPDGAGGWTYHVLRQFRGGTDGANPFGKLVFDAAGNLYGTASYGGNTRHGPNNGTVFELSPGSDGWTFTVLHNFGVKKSDGEEPLCDLVMDGLGSLYGTTLTGGGPHFPGVGTVFEVTP